MSIQVHFQIGSFSCLLHSWNLNSLHSYMEFLGSLAFIMGLSNDVQVLPWHIGDICVFSTLRPHYYFTITLKIFNTWLEKHQKWGSACCHSCRNTNLFTNHALLLLMTLRKREKWQTYAIHWWICMAIFIIQQLFCFREIMWVGHPKRCQSHLQRGRQSFTTIADNILATFVHVHQTWIWDL
jgi:hypothetical protein